MLIFSWTLTPNNVACLKAVMEHQRRDEEYTIAKKSQGNGVNPLSPPEVGNFIGATRGLFREGLIATREVPVEPWNRGGWTSPTRTKWEITEKGRLMLALVQLEIRDQAQILIGNMSVLKEISGDVNPTRGTLLSGKDRKK